MWCDWLDHSHFRWPIENSPDRLRQEPSSSVGAWVGMSVGGSVGVPVGARVGGSVGMSVGGSVGVCVGVAVGGSEGAWVGLQASSGS